MLISDIQNDLYRLTAHKDIRSFIRCYIRYRGFRLLVYHRVMGQKTIIPRWLVNRLSQSLQRKMHVELPASVQLGKGALFLHPYGIVIHRDAVIGENFTMLKGATIGLDLTKNVGVPQIGNNVYLGLNSTVVGSITIGDDVVIAANTFVNFDVPDGSVVLGSPGVIHRGSPELKKYTMNSIEQMNLSSNMQQQGR